jgi:hypothetical protein
MAATGKIFVFTATMMNTVAAFLPIIWLEQTGLARGSFRMGARQYPWEGTMMIRIRNVLEKALKENRITRQDWEAVMSLATVADDAVINGENETLFRLVSLLEGGEVSVEGVPHPEILRQLAVFS